MMLAEQGLQLRWRGLYVVTVVYNFHLEDLDDDDDDAIGHNGTWVGSV